MHFRCLLSFVTVIVGFVANKHNVKGAHASEVDDTRTLSNKLRGKNLAEKRLEFVHITKAGGTTIEHAGAQGGVAWGMCHYMSHLLCKGVTPDKRRKWIEGSSWHDHAENRYDDGTKTFTIVRNPYDRAISMYYYNNKKTPIDILNDRKYLIDFFLYAKKGEYAMTQSSYVFDEEKGGEKVIDYVLKLETLETDGNFEVLMKAFNLNVTLPKHRLNGRRDGSILRVKNLPKAAIEYINEYYRDDFINFGYDMIQY